MRSQLRPKFNVSRSASMRMVDVMMNDTMAASLAAVLAQIPEAELKRYVRDTYPLKALAERLRPDQPPRPGRPSLVA